MVYINIFYFSAVAVFFRLGHQLTFKNDEDMVVVAKDANKQDEDTFDIFDPRNPLNKRRREGGVKGEGRRKGGGRDSARNREQTIN